MPDRPENPSARAGVCRTPTRRSFLQLSGGGIALVVAGCDSSDADLGWGVILSDPALCGACSRCAITCSALNAGGSGGAHALVGPDASYQAHQLEDARWQADSCRQCPDVQGFDKRGVGGWAAPACVAHCPSGAAQIAHPRHPIYGDSRVRFIDGERCVRCGACVERCPYDHPLLTRDGPARKCDLCIGRYRSPPCVDACPSSALRYYPRWRKTVSRPFPWLEAAELP